MKSFFTKIISLVLAGLVLISTFSLTIEKHFCGDFLVDISFFGNTKGCTDEPAGENCDNPLVVKKNNCCKDEVKNIDGQDDLNISSFEKLAFKQPFIIETIVSDNNLFHYLKKQIVPYQHYPPPNLVTDIQLLYEVFLI